MHYAKGIQFVHVFVAAIETVKRYLANGFPQRATVGKERSVANDSAEHQASEWIARLNADDVSPDDGVRFEAWRKLHPRHARAYDELSATWRALTAGRPSDSERVNEIVSMARR